MTLKIGSKGPAVGLLQEAMNGYGANIKEDNDLGPETANACIAKCVEDFGIVVAEPPKAEGPSKYAVLYNSMVIRPEWVGRINAACDLIVKGRARYEAVAAKTAKVTYVDPETGKTYEARIPWHVIGIIHLLEADCSWTTHLHNGDSLKRRTVQEPKGRPVNGNPPFTWEESALDALAYDHIEPPLDTIPQMLAAFERYNGLGYQNKGVNTPYLWSGTNQYTKGKYVADGRWSATAVSEQVGAAPIIKTLIDRGLV